MGTIVVGYLSSPEGRAALAAGIAEGVRRSAKVVVVNSHKGGSSFSREDARTNEAELSQVEHDLRDAGVEYEVQGLVRGQDAPDDILDVVAETKAELVVIGLRHRSPVGKLLLGSNAQRILLESPAPVLAVKAPADDDD
jgi:nucleotide-binding universal stress UspA family protein